jgi:UDP-N-acetyl-D-mannosaminuronic acid transferase (WecB/TagA/CpsF family)
MSDIAVKDDISMTDRPAGAARRTQAANFHRILGIDFFDGSARAAIALMREGGLLVIPAAPALKDLDSNPGYRDALLNADLAITDSAFMVLIWNRLQQTRIRRLSGLEYLSVLLLEPGVRRPGNTVWIMASPSSAQRNRAWLERQGINIPDDHVYLAPMYAAAGCTEPSEDGSPSLSDPVLLERLERLRPQHIILTIGGGTQECLGLYLKRNLSYRPAIHCVGAAIAFLSGDQVSIPMWADRYYLGWLFRSLSEPKRYGPRYWEARKLLDLMRRNRGYLPPLKFCPPITAASVSNDRPLSHFGTVQK